jgi:hypothetical protein
VPAAPLEPDLDKSSSRIRRLLHSWRISPPLEGPRQAIELGPLLRVQTGGVHAGGTVAPVRTQSQWHCPVYVDGRATDAFAIVDDQGVVNVGRQPESELIAHVVREVRDGPRPVELSLVVFQGYLARKALRIEFPQERGYVVFVALDAGQPAADVLQRVRCVLEAARRRLSDVKRYCRELKVEPSSARRGDWCGILTMNERAESPPEEDTSLGIADSTCQEPDQHHTAPGLDIDLSTPDE